MHSYSGLRVDYTAAMSRSRPLRYFFVLSSFTLLGAGFYVYQNFSQLLTPQLRQFAQQYGVNDVRLGQIHVSTSNAKLDQLRLQGSYGGYGYTVSLRSIELNYDWRRLFSGQAQFASIGNTGYRKSSATARHRPTSCENAADQAYGPTLPIASTAPAFGQW